MFIWKRPRDNSLVSRDFQTTHVSNTMQTIVSSSSSNSSNGATADSGLSKWQVLALLGFGVSVTAVGLGAVWYLRRRSSTSSSSSSVPSAANKGTESDHLPAGVKLKSEIDSKGGTQPSEPTVWIACTMY